jgi:hypothetical protein
VNETRVGRRRVAGERNCLVQGTFGLVARDPVEFDVLLGGRIEGEGRPYRAILAAWPNRWRERWGRRANALEDQGLSWRAAEVLAFVEVQDEKRARATASRKRSRDMAAHN